VLSSVQAVAEVLPTPARCVEYLAIGHRDGFFGVIVALHLVEVDEQAVADGKEIAVLGQKRFVLTQIPGCHQRLVFGQAKPGRYAVSLQINNVLHVDELNNALREVNGHAPIMGIGRADEFHQQLNLLPEKTLPHSKLQVRQAP